MFMGFGSGLTFFLPEIGTNSDEKTRTLVNAKVRR
jgi:hypothetical protein